MATNQSVFNVINQEIEFLTIWKEITLLFEQATEILKTIVDYQINNDIDAFNTTVETYKQHWLQIGDILKESQQQPALLYTLLSFVDISTQSLQDLKSIQLTLLNQWHYLFNDYLITEDYLEISPLIECLSDSQWTRPLTKKSKNDLFIVLDNSKQLTINTETLNHYHHIWDKIRTFFNEAQIVTDKLTNRSNINELQNYAHYWSMIGETIANEEPKDLLSLGDICYLLVDNCQQLIKKNSCLNSEFNQLLKEWQLLFKIYLHDVSSEQNLFSLIKVLENNLWPVPLTAKDRIMFVELNTSNEENETNETKETIAVKPVVISPELIITLSNEFVLLVKNLSPAIMDISDKENFKIVLKIHYLKFKHLSKASETIGLQGLAKVFEFISANIIDGCENEIDFSKNERILFKDSLLLIQAYIMDVTNKNSVLALINHLQASEWKFSLDQSQAQTLAPLLLDLEISSEDAQLDNRKITAEENDISLKLPDEVNQELLDSLLNELPILTTNFSIVIQKIISSDPNIKQLIEAQRIAHTLKGSGNIVGITGITVLTHYLEEILEYLTEKQRFPTKELAVSLLEAADCLELMCEIILIGENQSPDDSLQILQSILDWANIIRKEGLPKKDEDSINLTPKLKKNDIKKTPEVTESVTMIRVSSTLIDKLLRMAGESSILREQLKEGLNQFSEELKTLNKLTWSIQTLVSKLDKSVNIHNYNSYNKNIYSQFDSLEMEQYSELHTVTSHLEEVATDIRNINISMDEQLVDLKYLIQDDDVIQKENQEIVQSIRMVTVSTIASRCQRIVRQACRMTNKEVELNIKGNDVLIDSKILNGMIDPLMHILRNSVDHGIETKDIRQQHHKNPLGKISLEFSHQGNYIIIRCQDDGKGLSNDNILQTAINKGLISVNQKLTDAEIQKLILMPGFSTRTNATQVSGRGIGMDIVQTKISELQGQMSFSSIKDQGLNIEIAIPQMLSSMLSLLVRCGSRTMAVSNRGLEKIHHPDDYQLIKNDTKEFSCQIGKERYSTRYFSELLGMPIAHNNTKKLPALRITDEIGKTYLVFVDELLGYRDLLVKDMGDYISHIQGITGASILGNGEVAPVIDVVELLHHSIKYDFLLDDATKSMINNVGKLPIALVVDDSLSARRSVVMLLEDFGLEVKTAIDGLDAIKEMESMRPNIMIVDLEMPRMNGIDFTAHIKGNEDTKNIPVIMITSRTTEKHRKQAKAAGVAVYMTKPFLEEELINNVSKLMSS